MMLMVTGSDAQDARNTVLNITHIRFSNDAVYSTLAAPVYRSVFISYEVLQPIYASSVDGSGNLVYSKVTATVPHSADGTLIEMSIGNNQQANFVNFPGHDVQSQFPDSTNWKFFNTPNFPLISNLQLQYSIQAYANTTSGDPDYLPVGYHGTVEITDVLMPESCKNPGEYTLRIGSAIAYHRPTHAGVMCPEFAQLELKWSDTVYDSTQVEVYATFEVTEYPLYAMDGYVEFLFPEGIFPNAYRLDEDARMILAMDANFTLETDAIGWDGLDQANITGVSTVSNREEADGPHRPRIRHLLEGNYARADPGSLVNVTVTNITLPWDCLTNQTFCVSIGYFSKCTKIERPITNCPVLKDLSLQFADSQYWTRDSTLTLTFNITENPLYAKPKYKVVIEFPNYRGFSVSGAWVKAAPMGYLQAASPAEGYAPMMMKYDPGTTHTFPVPPTIEFYLNGTGDQDVQWRQVYAENVVTFEIGNISLPLSCFEDPLTWKLQIGPWEVETVPAQSLITGCPILENLDVHFQPDYQGSHGVVATFTFDVTTAPLPLEPLKIVFPYYTGRSETFKIRSSMYDQLRFQVDGEANKPLTVYKGLTYYFEVESPHHPFGFVSAEGVYNDNMKVMGVPFATSLTSGVIEWEVPNFGLPNALHYVNPLKPWMNASISIEERPRGVQMTTNTRVTENATQMFQGDFYGEMFKDYAPDNFWMSLHEPVIEIQNMTEGVADTYSYVNFLILNDNAHKIPEGRLSFDVRNLALPADCTDIGNYTVFFGPWPVKNNPTTDLIKCPKIVNLDVTFSSQVIGEKGVIAYFKIDLFDAPLDPQEIKILFPPGDGLSLNDDAMFFTAFGNWRPTGAGPTVRNYKDIEVSISEQFIMGTPVLPNVTAGANETVNANETTIIVYGIDMPTHCNQLGNFTVMVGKWKIEANPIEDRIFCPNITDLDVFFSPTANQSATTDAIITFNVTDYVDPRKIIVSLPQDVDTHLAYFGSAMEDNGQPGWELNADTFESYNQDDWPTMSIVPNHVTSRRIAPGVHYIVIKNVTLPRGNCSDLGMWRVQIGDSVFLQANPENDVVENCVVLEDLDLDFLPDAEQGQIVDMVVSFDVEESSLNYVPGDSDWIRVDLSPESGLEFTWESKFKDVMGGSWLPDPNYNGNWPYLSHTHFYQKFSTGGTVPFAHRTQLTITNVKMPTTCFITGWWHLQIGIWSVRMVPINATNLAICPHITNLDVVYSPATPGSQNVDAQVHFDVEVIRLRPGKMKFNFPGDSFINMWAFTTITGPGDWKATDTAVIQPWHPKHHEGEISITQTFTGTPLEVGNYSFTIHGVALPDNNCSDLGSYKLAVDKWTSLWINPEWDDLSCPGLVAPINVTMIPYDLPRMYNNATFEIGFRTPTCVFNQVEITFPEGFAFNRVAGLPPVISASSALDLSGHKLVLTAPNVLQIQNVSGCGDPAPAHDRYDHWHTVTIDNVGLGNTCEKGSFRVSTTTCTHVDRSNGLSTPIRECPHTVHSASGFVTSEAAMPKYCGLCNACKYDHDLNSGSKAFECNENGITFQRIDLTGPCAEVTSEGANLW